jgi:putative SOS response-associated peptidase YedK
VPASWYFEWEHYLDKGGRKRTGDKYMIRPQGADTAMNKGDAQETDPAITWLCGLYRIEGGLPAFVILTREPGEKIRFIHDRMPLIMPGEMVNEWIRPDTKPEELLPYALTEMDFEKAL